MKERFIRDFRAGITSGVMMFPQSLVNALLEDMRKQHNRFITLLSTLIDGFMGIADVLSGGPIAVLSLLYSTYDPCL